MILCMDYEELVQDLKRHGLQLGYITLDCDLIFINQVDYWYKEYSVIRVKHSGVAVEEVVYVNDENYPCDSYLAILSLLTKLQLQTSTCKPTILKAFDGVLFQQYADSTTKYEKMLAVFPKFSSGFQALFADELDALAGPSTAMQIKPDMSKIYKNKLGNYCYITAITQDRILFKNIVPGSTDDVFDYRKLAKFTVDSEATIELQSLLCSLLSLISEVVDTSKMQEFIKNKNCNAKAFKVRDSDLLGKQFLLAGNKLCVRVSIDVGFVSVYLVEWKPSNEVSNEVTSTEFAHDFYDVPGSNSKYIIDLLQSTIRAFSVVLVANPELRKALFESLYSFDDKLDNKETSVSANQESIRSPQATETQKTDFASMALGISDSQGANADNPMAQPADLKRITIGGKGFYVVEGCTNEDATLCIAEEPWCDDVWGFNETSGKHILEVVDNNCNASCTYDWFGMLPDKIRSAIKSVNINTYEDDLSGSSEAQTCMFVPSRGEWEAVPFDVRRRIIKYKRAWTRSVPMQFGYEMYFVDCDGNFSSHNVGHHRYGIVPACYVNNVMIAELLGDSVPAMMNF